MRHFCTLHGWDAIEPLRPLHRRRAFPRGPAPAGDHVVGSGDVTDIEALYTPDVRGSGPATTAQSRDELMAEIEERRGALLHERVTFGRVESNGPVVRLEWEASGLHTGPLPLPGTGAVLEPTGLRLRVRAVTWARFEGQRIASWRGHWEDIALAS